jgi:hypothetical protein
MSKTYKFSKDGYDVEVVRKEDVLACIDNNILDKEIALELISQLEIDAGEALAQGKWVGFPKLGSFRLSPNQTYSLNDAQKKLLSDARAALPKDKYIMFRRQFEIENIEKRKINRVFNYILTISINRNKELYKKLCAEKGERWADIYMYSIRSIKAVSNNYLLLGEDNDEQDSTETND